MTNREWLESLGDRELAWAIVHISDVAWQYFYSYTDTATGIKEWLEAEREEEDE